MEFAFFTKAVPMRRRFNDKPKFYLYNTGCGI